MGIAGYNADLYITGTSTAMVTEACTEVTGFVFQITDSARRILDHAVDVVVFVNAVPQTSGFTVDYNFGIITFDSTQTGQTVTITANFLPRHQVAQIRAEEMTITWVTGDSTAQQDDGQDLTLTQKQVTLSVDAVQLLDTDFTGTTSLDDVFDAADAVVMEFQHLGGSSNVYRMRTVANSMGIANNGPAGLAGGSLNFVSAARGVTLVNTNLV